MKVICFCILILVLRVKCSSLPKKATPTSGPYRAILVRTEECKKTTSIVNNDPTFAVNLQVHKTSSKYLLLSGNITVLKENKQVQMKIKSFVLRNGKWKMTYLINNVGCHSVLLYMFVTSVGLKYNRETCGFYKGSYTFSDIDINNIQHIWASKMEYGRVLWTSEFVTGSTTYFCWEFKTLVEPLDR